MVGRIEMLGCPDLIARQIPIKLIFGIQKLFTTMSTV